MPLSVVYDPRHHTWDSWASLMCEAYAGQHLEIPSGEDNWKGWAAGFLANGLAGSAAVADPYQFEKWDDWAASVVNVITSRT